MDGRSKTGEEETVVTKNDRITELRGNIESDVPWLFSAGAGVVFVASRYDLFETVVGGLGTAEDGVERAFAL